MLTQNEFSYYKILSELYFRKRDYESASDVLSKLIELAPYKSEELIQPIENIVKKIPRHTKYEFYMPTFYSGHLNRLRGAHKLKP